MTAQSPVRVVHIDPHGFDDVAIERELFESAFEAIEFRTVDTGGDAVGADVGRADILLTHYAAVTEAAMDAVGCSVVTVYATGVDNVNVEAATERGVAVTNVPEYCNDEVGEHIVSLALALIRGLPQYDAQTAAGDWDWGAVSPVRRMSSLTFGFFAFGKKARAAAGLAAATGADVVAHDPYLSDAEITEAGATPVSFDELVEGSDILSLNAPLTPETEGLFDGSAFARMPADSVLINTARGELVDESALIDALENGPLHGAGLDVLATEPPNEDNPLLSRSDTVVTPHAAWFSPGAIQRLREQASEIGIAAYRGNAVDGVVNPEAFEKR
jgi:D-3-phosphoglycerate dehydrogenase